MEISKNLLQKSILHPCANYTYFETLDNVVENSKRLGEAMTHIASASKNTNHQLFIQAVQDASKAVCRLAESSAQVKIPRFFFFLHLNLNLSLGKLSYWCFRSNINKRNGTYC
jgi:talin